MSHAAVVAENVHTNELPGPELQNKGPENSPYGETSNVVPQAQTSPNPTDDALQFHTFMEATSTKAKVEVKEKMGAASPTAADANLTTKYNAPASTLAIVYTLVPADTIDAIDTSAPAATHSAVDPIAPAYKLAATNLIDTTDILAAINKPAINDTLVSVGTFAVSTTATNMLVGLTAFIPYEHPTYPLYMQTNAPRLNDNIKLRDTNTTATHHLQAITYDGTTNKNGTINLVSNSPTNAVNTDRIERNTYEEQTSVPDHPLASTIYVTTTLQRS